MSCGICGIHFPQDFDATLKTPCNFWGEHGLSNISVEDKRLIWDWIFKMPSDPMYIKYGINMVFSFGVTPIGKVQPFNELFENYDQLTEEEQQQLQRKYYSGGIPTFEKGQPNGKN